MDKLISALLVLFFGIFAAYDIFLETGRATTFHLITESIFVLVAFVWASYLIKQLFSARADVEHWRNESRKWADGLAQTIDQQFEA